METNPPGANRPLTNLAQSHSYSVKENSATLLLFWVISNFKSNTMLVVKVHETFDFLEIESVTIFCFCFKVCKKTVVLIWICYQVILFRGESADASCTELVGHKIARSNRKPFFYLNRHPLVHFLSDRSQQKVNLHYSLFQLLRFQMSIKKRITQYNNKRVTSGLNECRDISGHVAFRSRSPKNCVELNF